MPFFSRGEKGPVRSYRRTPPVHYILKVRPFSMLSRQIGSIWERSDIFEACGYKWRLILYPAGNPKEDCRGHMSVYMVMVDTYSMIFGWEVDVTLRLFLYNHIREEYMMVEEPSGARFTETNKQWGFARFVRLKTLYDASSGYLLNDECVLGAEVFVRNEKRTCKNELLSLIARPNRVSFTWKIENFLRSIQSPNNSKVFKVEDFKWMIMLHTTQNEATRCSSLSLNLVFMGAEQLPSGGKVYANYSLCIVDQKHSMDFVRNGGDWFLEDESCGWKSFIHLTEIHDQEKGFVCRDTCLIEADVSIVAVNFTS